MVFLLFYKYFFLFSQWLAGNRDGLIFLIDVTKPMFQKEEDEETSPFELCIKVLYTMYFLTDISLEALSMPLLNQ